MYLRYMSYGLMRFLFMLCLFFFRTSRCHVNSFQDLLVCLITFAVQCTDYSVDKKKSEKKTAEKITSNEVEVNCYEWLFWEDSCCTYSKEEIIARCAQFFNYHWSHYTNV